MKLDHKVALITGGSRGIGRAIALLFAREGADIAITYLKSEQQAQEVVREVKNLGRKAIAVKSDSSQYDPLQSMFDETIKAFGKVDILVNNVGIYDRTIFFESTEADWDRTMNTNLKSAYFCSQIAAKHMKENGGGNIINISSNAGIKPNVHKGIEYGISKCAIIYLTQALALTLASENIRVNCIAPGYTDTDMAKYKNDLELKKQVEQGIPSERTNQPEEIAQAALFLASDSAKNITGQVIVIDGGSVIK